jgi:hypothetical protein
VGDRQDGHDRFAGVSRRDQHHGAWTVLQSLLPPLLLLGPPEIAIAQHQARHRLWEGHRFQSFISTS